MIHGQRREPVILSRVHAGVAWCPLDLLGRWRTWSGLCRVQTAALFDRRATSYRELPNLAGLVEPVTMTWRDSRYADRQAFVNRYQ